MLSSLCLYFLLVRPLTTLSLSLFPHLADCLLTRNSVELFQILLLFWQILLTEDLIKAEYQREEVEQANYKQ